LLEWRSPELKVLGKRSGAVITGAGGIYRFQQTTGKGTGFGNCDEAWEGLSEPGPKNHFAVTTQGAKLQRLDAPGDVAVAELPEVEGVTTYSNGVELQASLGSYLFIDEWEDSVYCTANHGLNSTSSRVFDVAQRVSVEFPTKADEFVLREEAQQSNRKALEVCRQAVRDAHSGEPPSGATPELADLSLRRVTPTWTSAKGLRFQLDFGVLSTYVVGEKTCTLIVSHAPPSLERFKLPSAFAALSRKLPGLTVSGWSLLEPADATALAAAQRVFGKR
jgi:hypothetical protein